MDNYRKKIYESYITTTRSKHFDYSKKEYDYFAMELALNYGRFLPNSKDGRILELGCGGGQFLYWLDKANFRNYTGIDCSPDQVELSKNVCKGEVILADMAEFLKNTEDKYDLIFSRHVFEHLRKDEVFGILETVKARLTPGGKLIIELPNNGSPLFGAHTRYIDFTHETGFTVESIEQILKATGFKIVGSGPFIVRNSAKRFIFSLLNKTLQAVSKKSIFFDTTIFAIGEKHFT